MGYPSISYTLRNGTVMSSSQLNQNFQDILSGMTLGVHDFNISALTCAGTVNFSGSTVIGSSSADDLTVNASLASDIPISVTNSYNIGSATKGLAGLYLGTSDTDTARIVSAALAASRTYTLPDAGAAASFVMTEGSQTVSGTKTFASQLIGKGTAAADDAAAGYIGEILTTTYSASATGIEQNVALLLLTDGDWDVTTCLVVNRNSANLSNVTSATPFAELKVVSASGSSSTLGDNFVKEVCTFDNNSSYLTLNLGPIRVKCSSSGVTIGEQSPPGTSKYVCTAIRVGNIISGTPLVSGSLTARRVR